VAWFSLSRTQKGVASALAIIPITIAGLFLIRCGCSVAAFTIEVTVGLVYFLWIAL
jgi:hypothetical protein